MSMGSAMVALAEFTEGQWGMVTRAQAIRLGVAESTLGRMAAAGALEHVTHGVYRVRGGATHPEQGLYAEWLMLKPATSAWQRQVSDGVVSHQSAAFCYQIGDLSAYVHEFTLPVRRQATRTSIRLHRRAIGAEGVEWEWVHDMPITRPPRLVGDLLRDRQDPSAVAKVAAEALAKHLTTREELIEAAKSWGNPYGRRFTTGEKIVDWLASIALTSSVGVKD